MLFTCLTYHQPHTSDLKCFTTWKSVDGDSIRYFEEGNKKTGAVLIPRQMTRPLATFQSVNYDSNLQLLFLQKLLRQASFTLHVIKVMSSWPWTWLYIYYTWLYISTHYVMMTFLNLTTILYFTLRGLCLCNNTHTKSRGAPLSNTQTETALYRYRKQRCAVASLTFMLHLL
jgi:hypothetical protein